MNELSEKVCESCDQGGEALRGERLAALQKELGHDWEVKNEHELEKLFKFPDFTQALDFTNKVGAVAEEIGHHPDIYLTWGKVKITIYTHKVDGLTENDFVLAAKIEKMIQDECGKKIKSV